MRKTSALILGLLGFGLVFTLGSWVGWQTAVGRAQRAGSERQVLYYSCPMHPAYHSDRQGDCPSCGMRLEAVYADGAGPSGPPDASRLVRVSAERQQVIGVRTGLVEEAAGRQTVRTVGRVVPDETRIYPIFAATDGWIQEVGDTSTGSMVRKGQRLGSYYSPELVPALQRYFLTIPAPGAGPRNYSNASVETIVQQAGDQLRSLGMTEAQIQEVNRTRAQSKEIWILAPAPGFVLERNISVGQRFDKGEQLYRIADLTRMWVMADLFGRQADYVKPGTMARVMMPDRDRAYAARVSRSQPLFDETTRTLKVRLETDNPGYALKPGMFVDVEFPVDLPASLVVPAEAVVDTGTRKTVFVDRGQGYFEPRQVQTGSRIGGHVEILKGLMAGERIVISGTFLIDSESRMMAASAGIFGASAKDPVCGMEVDQKRAAAAGRTVEHTGETYYFCADDCKRKFEEHPEQYTQAEGGGRKADNDHGGRVPGPAPTHSIPMPSAAKAANHPAAEPPGPVKDLVCGMDVDPKEAEAAGLKADHAGKAYYFCSEDCKKKFQANPAEYIH